MRLPVPNLIAALVNNKGKVIPPWNSWFQQFSEAAPEAMLITGNSFTANTPGVLIIESGVPAIVLVRGTFSVTLTGQKIIPISIGDTVNLSGAYVAHFLGD